MSELLNLISDTLSYQLDAALQLILVTMAGALFAIFFNRRGWKVELKKLTPPSLRVNLIVYSVDALVLAMPLGLLVGTLYGHLGSIVVTTHLADFPVWALAVSCVVVGDFVGYWRHRLEHSRLLWNAHSLHHSDEQMTWFTVFRIHPIDRLLTVVVDYSILFVLGFPIWAIALSGTIRHFYGMFVHMNRPWTLGVLSWVLVSPAMHRWHHVRTGRGMYSNYAAVFSIFDRMFGTYYVPGPCHDRLGVEGVIHTEYFSQMMLPLAGALKRLRQIELFGRSVPYQKP